MVCDKGAVQVPLEPTWMPSEASLSHSGTVIVRRGDTPSPPPKEIGVLWHPF